MLQYNIKISFLKAIKWLHLLSFCKICFPRRGSFILWSYGLWQPTVLQKGTEVSEEGTASVFLLQPRRPQYGITKISLIGVHGILFASIHCTLRYDCRKSTKDPASSFTKERKATVSIINLRNKNTYESYIMAGLTCKYYPYYKDIQCNDFRGRRW
jgi:hypothetical protein